MLELIKNLCSLNGISGREKSVREFIISQIEGHCEYSTDALGNLIVFKKGKNPSKNKVLIDAHMDEVGMIVTGADSNGFVKFAKVGGINTKVIIGRAVYIGEQKIPGVIGIKPIHLAESGEKSEIPKEDSLYIDIGADSKEQALEVVSYGDAVYLEGDFTEFGDGFICSKALDDRAGCAILIELIKSELEYDCYFSFSVQEEIGLRGAATASFSVNPDYAIVSETTTAADISGVEGDDRVCVCGEGVAVSFMDTSTVYDKDLFSKALEIAKIKGIKAQVKTRVAGGNNAGSIHKSGTGVKTLTLSVPCRYLHSASCVCKYEDILSAKDLVREMISEFATC